MKSRLLWDRFLCHWLPPDEATGNVTRDIDRALARTYGRHTFAQKGGLATVVVTEAETKVASRIPPHTAQCEWPGWLAFCGWLSGKEQAAILNDAIRDLIVRPRPHVILKTGRRSFTLDGIVAGNGTAVVVNEPGKTTVTDAARIVRARRALAVLGSVGQAQKARKLLDDREAAVGDSEVIDRKIRDMVRKLRVEHGAFFDAIDLLDHVTPLELRLAGETQ